MGNSIHLTSMSMAMAVIAPSNINVQVIRTEDLGHIEMPGKFVSTVCCHVHNPICEENVELIQIGQEIELSISPVTRSLYSSPKYVSAHSINVYNWLVKDYLVLKEGSWSQAEVDMFIMVHGQRLFDEIRWIYESE